MVDPVGEEGRKVKIKSFWYDSRVFGHGGGRRTTAFPVWVIGYKMTVGNNR